nr:hypothetical protein [Tanacetum cinerariifolium]
MNAILGVYTELDEVTNIQCDYLELLQKCECLETDFSKSKKMSKSFESVQKHAINLELKLQQCKEKDLKAQLQDKGIAISELKKLIEKLKGKSVDTKFKKSSVIRQPNAFKSPRPSVLGKPTTFSNSFIRKDFSKSTSITKNNVSNDISKPVTAQNLPMNKKSCLKNTNVLAPGMYKIHTDHTQARTSKLPQDSKKTNKRGDRVLRGNSRGKKLEVEEPRRNVKLSKNKTSVTACSDSLNAKTYFEIQDLKAQLQDKSIAISELKKLIEKMKGKSVDTKIEKSSVIRQPNAFKSSRPSILGKPNAFSNSFIRNDFSTSTSVTKNNVSNDFSKHVPAQTLPAKKKPCLKNTNMLAHGMYKIRTDHTQAKTSKLPQDSKKTNKSVSFSTGVIPTTSVSRPQLKSNPKGDRVLRSNSGGKKLEVEEPRRNVMSSKNKMPVTAYTANLNVKTVNVKSVSAMCAKYVMIKEHDLRVPKSVAKPPRKTVATESIKKPRNNVRKLNEHFGKTHKWT